MSKFFSRAMLAAVALAAHVARANAGTATATMNVTATIGTSCIISPTTLNFGTIPSVAGLNVYASTNISVVCSNLTNYTMDLDQGLHWIINERNLVDGSGDVLNYDLCKDSACTQYWGSTSNGTTVSGTGTGSTQNYFVYGKVHQSVYTAAPGGTYTDVVTMTISY